MRISHEAIYQALYFQGRGSVETSGTLSRACALAICPSCSFAKAPGSGKNFPTRRSDFPPAAAEVDDRRHSGASGSDLIRGAQRVQRLKTLVERTTRFNPCCCHLPMQGHGEHSHGSRTAPTLTGHWCRGGFAECDRCNDRHASCSACADP